MDGCTAARLLGSVCLARLAVAHRRKPRRARGRGEPRRASADTDVALARRRRRICGRSCVGRCGDLSGRRSLASPRGAVAGGGEDAARPAGGFRRSWARARRSTRRVVRRPVHCGGRGVQEPRHFCGAKPVSGMAAPVLRGGARLGGSRAAARSHRNERRPPGASSGQPPFAPSLTRSDGGRDRARCSRAAVRRLRRRSGSLFVRR